MLMSMFAATVVFAAEPAPEEKASSSESKPLSESAEPQATTSAQPQATTSAQPPAANRQQPASGRRGDRLDLDTTVVTGNRELPKVLYIVPWKKADIGDLPAQPFNTLLDEALTPVDRDVFRREVTYYEAARSGADATQSTSEPRP